MGQWENNYTVLPNRKFEFHFASLILGSRHLSDLLPQLAESHLQRQLQLLDVAGQATQPQGLRFPQKFRCFSDLVIHWSRKRVVGCI